MNRKGFTLIELLAVIVILAIIALIATPVILNIIEDARASANKRSIELYGNAVEQAIARYNMSNPQKIYGSLKTEDGKTLTNDNLGILLKVDYDGDVVCDYIQVSTKGEVVISNCIVNGKEVDYVLAPPMKNMLYQKHYILQENPTDYTFLNTNIKSAQIETLDFHTNGTTIENADEYESIDCSFNQDESVMCYFKVIETVDEKDYYEFHIAADGEIYAPYDSSGLLYCMGYDKMTSLNLTGLNTKYAINMATFLAYAGHNLMTAINFGDEFDTSNVTTMISLFYEMGYNQMTSLKLSDKFDTSNVIDMTYMFLGTGYNKMTVLELGDKFNTSNVIRMDAMFVNVGLKNLIYLDLGEHFDTSKVVSMRSMFESAGIENMTGLDLGENFNTSNVENMESMFARTGYYKMTELNLKNYFDTSKVTNMSQMFYKTGYASMTKLNLGKKFIISENTNTEQIFYNCGKQDANTRIIVYNQALKDKIQGLSDEDSPSLWKTENGIIDVQ